MNRDEEEEEDENAEYEGELVGEYVPVDRNRGGGLGYSSCNCCFLDSVKYTANDDVFR